MAYTDLKYLKTITDGDKQIIGEMIEMFVQQVPDFVKNFREFYATHQYASLGKEVHKAKSSLQIMGMVELEKEMKIFQSKIIDGTDVESYPDHIRHFETQCSMAFTELREELARL
jgi:HPt (histidine-containing phosphotransfer) domain-containing protein